jgi:hypothetical protein
MVVTVDPAPLRLLAVVEVKRARIRPRPMTLSSSSIVALYSLRVFSP